MEGDTSRLTGFSIDGERILKISSEATQSLSNGLRVEANGKGYSRNLTGDSRASSSTCFQPWLRVSRSGDPEVSKTRRDGLEEESEPRSNRLASNRLAL